MIGQLYQQLVTLLADIQVPSLSPILFICYNLGTIAFFIFLLRLLALVVRYPSNYSRWSWGFLLGLFGFGRAMTTLQLMLHKDLGSSIPVAVAFGVGIFVITYFCVPVVTKVFQTVLK